MTRLFLNIYDSLQRHKRLCFSLMAIITALLLVATSSLRYNENIYDFLPLEGNGQKAMTLYQDISGSQRLIALISQRDTTEDNAERLTQAVDSFAGRLNSGHGRVHIKDLTTQVDFEKVMGISDFVYRNMPLLLTDSDFDDMERRIEDPSYIDEQLTSDLEMMMMPAAGTFSSSIANDPLRLFSPVMQRLESKQRTLPYETDNGYIFTPDKRNAIVMMTTPYGAVESAMNAKLIEYVDSAARQTMLEMPDISVEVTGAPVIAVDNAHQIKQDSMWAITIAVVLILALLVFSFHSARSLILIAVSIGFGWIFALGGIAVLRSEMSLIVLGIGSIIIGIAVNYPLHFIAHTAHSSKTREVLKDLVAPLLIGNVTTVGAFACLIPLDAPALHDLGLFAAFMLVGTILFVLIFLPHIVRSRTAESKERLPFGRIAEVTPENNRWLVLLMLAGTLVLGYFSLSTSFDANMHHINYITPQQERLLGRLHAASGITDSTTVYLVTEGSSWDEALDRRQKMTGAVDHVLATGKAKKAANVTKLVCSKSEQQRRINRWNSFWNKHKDYVSRCLSEKAPEYGFDDEAFTGFMEIINADYTPQDIEYFEPLTSTLLSGSLSTANGTCSVVEVLQVAPKDISDVKAYLDKSLDDNGYTFDFVELNSNIANTLSDNFNYIGFACGFIVFIFLWLSFGRLELSILAFLPMVVGWIWILGAMSIFGMQFNIINVILATFIFGQGDDYTIFMTDGLINEYAYRRKLLPSYKNSIVISALIMFVGMGALIIARHPALHSLGEVTIVGMFTVVLMAWLVPPLVFGWIVSNAGRPRLVPVTIEQIVRTFYCGVVYLFELCYGNIFGTIIAILPGNKKKREDWFHRMICKTMRTNATHIWNVKSQALNPYNETFSKGSIIVCNHSSILDPIFLLSLSPKVIPLIGHHVWRNPIVHTMFKFARFTDISKPMEELQEYISEMTSEGYNVVIFPEGQRSGEGEMRRFHRGAFHLAMQTGTDLLPITIHGFGHVMPKGSGLAAKGTLTIEIGKRITAGEISQYNGDYRRLASDTHSLFVRAYEDLRSRVEDSHYFHHYVIYKYIYKGMAIERETRRLLKQHDDYSQWIDRRYDTAAVNVVNAGRGQFALLFALVHRDIQVNAYVFCPDDAALISAMTPMPANLHVTCCGDIAQCTGSMPEAGTTFLLTPTSDMQEALKGLAVTEIK